MSSQFHPPPHCIPVLLLKTQSKPHDAYEEYFAGLGNREPTGSLSIDTVGAAHGAAFRPEFVPVLEHRPNLDNLRVLEELLKRGGLGDQYGGMIFTSQRAVEAWADVVMRAARWEEGSEQQQDAGSGVIRKSSDISDPHQGANPPPLPQALLDDDFFFPLYTVGPATSRALNTLVTESPTSSPFARLHPTTFGEQTGNGDALAQYVLHHYNTLHSQRLYTFYEAPRLPFTPLIGPPLGERILKDDKRLKKKPLLFLVGEQRRDIIPKTLMDVDNKLPMQERIQVDELEVYVTATMESFQDDFRAKIDVAKAERRNTVVVVVFSPQGCDAMLRSLGYIDEEDSLTELARRRWEEEEEEDDDDNDDVGKQVEHGHQSQRFIIATIGPTTRDHLKTKYGFDADVCAAKPSPQGVGLGIEEFMRRRGLV